MSHVLSVILWLPIITAVLLALLPRKWAAEIKAIGLVAALIEFIVSPTILTHFQDGVAGMQLVEAKPWIRAWGVTYSLGVDGISLCLVLLTTLLTPLVFLSSWNPITKHPNEYVIPYLVTEAATGGSIILAGVMLKVGTYGFLRFVLPFFPNATATYAPWLIALSVIGVIYGALVAWVQPDMKKLVAYSSVSHLGFCVLGIFALQQTAIEGSILQMVNHGLSTGALFLLVGVIYERRHTRKLSDYGGLGAVMPVH